MPPGAFLSLDATTFASDVPLGNSVALVGKGGKSDETKCNNIRGRLRKWAYNSTYGKILWYGPAKGWIRSNELVRGPYNHSSWVLEPDQSSHCLVELAIFSWILQDDAHTSEYNQY